MNKEETLALWQQGKDAWNAWAQQMLARRAEMEQDGTWSASREFVGQEKPRNEATAAWMREAAVEFSGQVFETEINFSNFLFPGSVSFKLASFKHDTHFDNAIFSGYARFDYATFRKNVRFDSATFEGNAQFYSATFSGYARFDNKATFRGDAGFGSAKFSGYAGFSTARFVGGYAGFGSATFSGDVRFDSATFRGFTAFGSVTFSGYAGFDSVKFSGGYTGFAQATFKETANFANSTFRGLADFGAMQGERAFSLKGVSFAEVPDFIQAHFSEAPQLDHVSIPEVGGIARFLLPMLSGIDASPGLTARYRALKRLAIEAHDHTRELDYFANELKASRGYPDSPLPCPLNFVRKDEHGKRLPVWPEGLHFLFGLGYEALSNFGRSMGLPLIWWAVATAAFFWAYLVQAVAGDQCAAGGSDSTPWSAALGLSIRKALPFAGIASSEKLNQIYACLYGIHGQTGPGAELTSGFTPVIPDAVDYLGMLQLVLSILLLFLLLLAVRSHFRIR